MKTLSISILCTLLCACLPEPSNVGTAAPTLEPIGNQRAIVGEALTITLTVGVVDAVIYSSDGSVGPGKNPYAQATPAVFDPTTATFTWTPTGAEVGEYSVKFVATEPGESSRMAEETVAISVITVQQYGAELLGEYCASCHGADGTGFTGPFILRQTADDIAKALQVIPEMSTLQSELSSGQIHAVALYLEQMLAQARVHSGVDLSQGCGTCHNNFYASGKPAYHPTTTDRCEICHQQTVWRPVWLFYSMHTDVIPGYCMECHGPGPSSRG